jgi:dienelactone hydrolase
MVESLKLHGRGRMLVRPRISSTGSRPLKTDALRPRCQLTGPFVLFFLLCQGTLLAQIAAPPAGLTTGPVFTANDFPALAKGVDPGVAGEVALRVWVPASQDWHLTQDGDTVSLKSTAGGHDSVPRWQTVGKVTIRAGHPLKIEVEAKKQPADAKGKPKEEPVAVPALLVLSNESQPDIERVLDLVRGRVDSIDPSPDRRRETIRTNREGADFQPPASAQAWRDRALHLREQMLVALGLWPMPPKTALNPVIRGKLEREGYTIEKVVLETLPGFTLSGNLYRPAKSVGSTPAVLCPHGHWEDGRVNPEVQQRCIRWAKLGCVVFLYDMVGYNDSKPFTHAFLNDRLRRWGLSLTGLQTWNSIRALDWLTTLPDVDPARIGCTGESGGGTQTFLLTALDERIKVAAPVVMVSDSFQGGCVCENAAGLRHGTDNVEFAALCAPRPMILVGASGDWTAKTMSRAFPTIRGVYSLIGSTSRLEAAVFDFPHNYNQTSRNAVYAFMGRWLLGIEDSASTREGVQQVEKPEALWTFDAAHPAQPARKTPAQLEEHLIKTLGDQLSALAPSSTHPERWDAARRFLMVSLRNRVGLVNPPPETIEEHEVRRLSREGFTILHSLLGRKGRGEAIPVVRLIPARASGRLTVIADSRGKAALATATGQPAALVRALLASGQSVVGFDPLFVGETIAPARPASRRPDTAHFETYNPSVAADQIQDLATVASWARAQPDVREVSLVCQGLAGPQALLARPLLEDLARTVVDLGGWPGGDDSGAFPAALDLPGLFQFGGLKAAAALSAPAPLWIMGAGPSFAKAWPEAAYAISGASQALRFSAESAPPEVLARWIDKGE